MISKVNYAKLEPFIKASSILKGSENEKAAKELQKHIKLFKDTPSGDSLLLAGKNAIKNIVPENSINYIA